MALKDMSVPILFGSFPTILSIIIIWLSIGADNYIVDIEYLNGMITILGLLFAIWMYFLGKPPKNDNEKWLQKHLIHKYFLIVFVTSLCISIISFYYSSLHKYIYIYSTYFSSSFITLIILTISIFYNLFFVIAILYYIYYKGTEN